LQVEVSVFIIYVEKGTPIFPKIKPRISQIYKYHPE
jgi:hypothetical protein